MKKLVINHCSIVADFELDEKEAQAYYDYINTRHPHPDMIELHLDDEFVDIKSYHTRPFERIRRITGYLVGTIDRWNNGKKAEEADRVKHSV